MYLQSRLRTQWLLTIGLLAMLAGFIAFTAYDEYRKLELQERGRLAAQAKIIGVHFEHQLDALNRALANVRDETPEWVKDKQRGMEQANRRLQAFADTIPPLRTILLISADGKVMAVGSVIPGSHEKLLGLNVRHRDYFRVPAEGNDREKLYISPPFKTALGGLVINVGRVIQGLNGEFAGLVTAALDPEEFSVFLRSTLYSQAMSSAVIHENGQLFMSEPGQPTSSPLDFSAPGSYFHRHKASGDASSVFSGQSLPVKVESLMALHTVKPESLHMDRSLIVSVAREQEAIYASWRREVGYRIGLFAIVSLAVLGALYVVHRRQAMAETQVAEKDRLLKNTLRLQRAILDNAAYSIIATNAEGVVTEFNQAAENMLGYAADEIVGRGTPEIFHVAEEVAARAKEFGPAVGKQLEPGFDVFVVKARHDLPNEHEWTYVRKDGSRFPVLLSVTVLYDDQQDIIGYLGIAADITERKRTQEVLELSARRLSEAQRIAELGNWELDLTTQSMSCSEEALSILGLETESKPITFDTFLRVLHPSDRAAFEISLNASINNKRPLDLVHRLQCDDETIKHLHQRGEVEYGSDGTALKVLGTVQDVTLERLNEEAIRESEQRFRTVADYTYDWEFWRGPNREFLYISPSCERVTGYAQHEFVSDPGLTERIVHPDDRELVEHHLADYRDDAAHAIDFRIIRKDGAIRWIAHGCRPVFGRNGEFAGRRVSNRDITDRKVIENVLHESEERFRLISMAAKDAIIIVGPDEQISYWNPAGETIFGYPVDEAVGKKLHQLLAPTRYWEDAHRSFEYFSLTGQGPVVGKTFEVMALRKDGQEFPAELSISALRMKDRWHALGIVRDITDRKRAEERIKELAYFDSLTGLPNRRLLIDRLDHALSQAKRFQRSVALMFLDLDHFKDVNDTLGHEAGDGLLKEVALRLTSCIRTGDTVSRQGGDEFVIVLTEIAHPSDAAQVAEKIIKALGAPCRIADRDLVITTSIGISVFPVDGTDDIRELMKKADNAMYSAKNAGRNRYKFFDATVPNG